MEDGGGGWLRGGGTAKKGSIECKETRPCDLDHYINLPYVSQYVNKDGKIL
jgi:hypothetical protein